MDYKYREVIITAEYTSHGVGAAGLTTGIIGTSLGVLNSGLLNGIGIGGLFGNNGNCSDNIAVNRYEASQNAKIAALETEVKLRDANFYTLSEMGKLKDYVDNRLTGIESEICNQRTYNATNTAALNCMSGQIAQLYSLTQLKIPNASVCPGWGDVTVSVTPATTTGA